MAIESLEQLEKTIKLRVELKGTPEEPSPQVEWKLGGGGQLGSLRTSHCLLWNLDCSCLMSVMDHLQDSEAGALPWPEAEAPARSEELCSKACR